MPAFNSGSSKILIYRTACSNLMIIYSRYQVESYSGRMLIRFGSTVAWSFLISFAVTRVESRDSERRFCRSFKCLRPALDTREFDTFKLTKAVRPVNQMAMRFQL